MKKTSYFLLLKLIVILCVMGTAPRSQGAEIRISYFNSIPHVYLDKDTGQLKGAVYDLLEKHIAGRMNVKFRWDSEPSGIARQLKNLGDGERDAMALLTYSPERARDYEYSSKPYFEAQPGLLFRQGSQSALKTISKIKDILHLKIGYAKNTYLSEFMRYSIIKWDMVGHPDFILANIERLMRGRIDAVYSPDSTGLLYAAKKMNLEKEILIIPLPEKPVEFHIVFSKHSKDDADNFNRAFSAAEGEKLYLEILKQYIDMPEVK